MFVLTVVDVFLLPIVSLIVGLMLVEATQKATNHIQRVADLKQQKHGSSIENSL